MTSMPPLPSVEPYGYTAFKRWAEEYAAAVRAVALDEAANEVLRHADERKEDYVDASICAAAIRALKNAT